MSSLIVNNVSEVIDTLYNGFPKTVIENLLDRNGSELPIKGVFFQNSEEAKRFHSESRLVVLHSKSENYFFQSLEDVVDQAITAYKAIRAMGAEEVSMRYSFHQGYHVSFSTELTREKRKIIFENDLTYPSYMLSFPYYSTTKGQGLVNRIICSNLFTTEKIAGFSFSVRHTKNMGEKMIDIEKGIGRIAQNWDSFVDQCNRMATKVIDPRTFYASLYGEKPSEGRALTTWEKRFNAIDDRLSSESFKLGIPRTNGWMLFNALQGYLQHDTTRKVDDYLVRSLSASSSPILKDAESLLLGA